MQLSKYINNSKNNKLYLLTAAEITVKIEFLVYVTLLFANR